jgi:replicative DNA helicase
MPLPDRQPPYAPEAEISVLGGMLIDSENAVPKAIELVDDTMFYREANRRVFRSMVRLFQRGEVIDPVTLSEELNKTDELEAIGGMMFLSELLDAVPTAANIEYHARIGRELALLRRLIEVASQIIRDSYESGEKSVEEVLDAAEQRIFQVAQSHEREGFVWIKKILYPTFEKIEQLQASKGGITGVPSGFSSLDDMTGGLQRGDLVIVAARPSMGKTALVTGMALHAAIANQVPCAMFSLEMSKQQVVQRMLCSEGLVDLGRLLRGRLQDDDFGRLAQAAGHLNTAPLWIDDSGSVSILEMRAKARRLKADQPELGLIVVDYIQLMTAGGDSENRQQEVSAISRGLKALAKELNVPIVALSQLSDLRESGSIEQDADLVMFLYRPEYYVPANEAQEKGLQGKAELIISKQRNGPTGICELYFRKECARFESFTNAMPN